MSIQNGIWLCNLCARQIDRDATQFPRELLLEWRRQHEEWIGAAGSRPLWPQVELTTRPADFGFFRDLRHEDAEWGRQDTRNISLAYQETVEAQRSATHEIIRQQLDLAKRYIEEGRYQVAWDVLQLGSGEGYGWTDDLRYARLTRLGSCHLAFMRQAEAKASFEEALRLRPDYPQAVTNLVIARDLCDDPVEESLRLLEPVLRSDPTLPEAVHTKANLLLSQGKPQQSIELLEGQARLRRDVDIRRDYALANAYRLAGELEKAEALARDCVAREPGEAEAHELLGDVLLSQAITSTESHGLANTLLSDLRIDRTRLVEACGEFEQAAEQYNQNGRAAAAARCLVNGGLCHLELGSITSARDAYARAAAAGPPRSVLVPALRGLARVEMSEGDMEAARLHFLHAVELDPADLPTIYNLSLTLVSARRFPEALERLTPLRNHPDLPTSLKLDVEVLFAQALRHQAEEGDDGAAQREEAEALLAKVIETYLNPWQAYLERALWHLHEGQAEAALASIRRAQEIAPDNLLVLEIAAKVLLDHDASAEFAAVSQRLIERNKEAGRPNRPALYHNCAAALVNTGRVREALAVLDSAAGEGFAPTELLDIRASVFTRLHQHREAATCWRKLLEAEPNSLRALLGLAQAEWNLFNLDEAYWLLVRAHESGDVDALAFLNLATICREMEAAPEAVRWAEAAVAAGANKSPEMFMSAICAVREGGRWDLASKWLLEFRERWPDSPLIWLQEAPTRQERDRQMAELRARHDEHVRLAWLAYQCQTLPLAWLSQETGLPLPSLWEQIIQREDDEYEIRCHGGTPADDLLQAAVAFEARQITVDFTALLTLELLGHLYLLPRMFDAVIVPEHFFLQVRNSMIRVKEPATRLRLHQIIRFLARHPVVKRVGVVEVDSAPEGEQDASAGAESALPLFTDEAVIQYLVREQGGVAFGICGFLKATRHKGLIDEAEYWRCIRLLISHSYTAIPLRSNEIADTIRSDPRFDNRAARSMLARVGRPEVERRLSSAVLGEVLWSLFTDWVAGCEDLRQPWIDSILEQSHQDDPDDFWLQHAIYRCSRLLCENSTDDQAATCIRAIYDWAKTRRVDSAVMKRAVGQAARSVGRRTEAIRPLIRKLASGCPRNFQRLVRAEALPDLGITGSACMPRDNDGHSATCARPC